MLVMILMVATMGLRPAAAGRRRRARLVPRRHPGARPDGPHHQHRRAVRADPDLGMVVDGATIVVEYADRKMAEGMPRREAYRLAAQRMAWPVIAGTATTLAAFLPLLFWPGIVGEFMKFLPITVLATLIASIAFAMVFVPVIGSFVGKVGEPSEASKRAARPRPSRATSTSSRGFTGLYVRMLRRLHALRRHGDRPRRRSLLLGQLVRAYAHLRQGRRVLPRRRAGRGARPGACPRRPVGASSATRWCARSRRASWACRRHRHRLCAQRRRASAAGRRRGRDRRHPARVHRLADAPAGLARSWPRCASARPISPGIWIEVRKAEAGPPVGKPVQLADRLARSRRSSTPWPTRCATSSTRLPGLRDITDSRPAPGIEWRFDVDRDQAGRFGADIATVGTFVQLVTNGVLIGDYRPDDTDDEIDIRARYRPRRPQHRAVRPAAREHRRRARCRSATSSTRTPRRGSAISTASTASAC